MDCGLEAAGFRTLFATDIDYHSCVTLRHARLRAYLGEDGGLLNAAIVQSDINALTPAMILDKSGIKIGELDLLTGGPPCQSFSVFGRRQGLNDPRGKLVWQYLRILRGTLPKVFVFENVPGLLTIEGGTVFERFLDEVQKTSKGSSYSVKKYVLEAARYGVPQFRTRVIVVGVLNGIGLQPPPETGPIETHGGEHKVWMRGNGFDLPFNTVTDALQNLPKIGAAASPRNHVGRIHGEEIISRYGRLSFGERDSKTRVNKLHPERPSFTIIVGSDKGGGKGHVNPFEPREVTPRESARIQTFPDWWGFSGTSRHPIRQIGNAVPPVLAAAIGSFILERIFKYPSVARKDIWAKLGQNHLLDAEEKKLKLLNDEQLDLNNRHKHPGPQMYLPLQANTKRSLDL